jgi:hypothetical protein
MCIFSVILWDVEVSELFFTLWDEDTLSPNSVMGKAHLKLSHLLSSSHHHHHHHPVETGMMMHKKETFQLPIRLSRKASRDLKVQQPSLTIEVEYFYCELTSSPLSSSFLEKVTENMDSSSIVESASSYQDSDDDNDDDDDEDVIDDDVDEDGSLTQDTSLTQDLLVVPTSTPGLMGILCVKNLEVSGVQSMCGRNISNETIYVTIECCNVTSDTSKKHNKPPPFSLHWLESFYFIMKLDEDVSSTHHHHPASSASSSHHSKVILRLSVMQKTGHLHAVMGKTLNMVSFGELRYADKHKDKELGYIEVYYSDLLQSSDGCLELRSLNLISDVVFGEISFDCDFMSSS